MTEGVERAMTTCEPCALRAAGSTAAADALEHTRGQRLLLAMLNGAEDATCEISTELHDCHDCIGRLAALYLGMTAGALVQLTGGSDAAVKWIERGLLEDLDGPAPT